MGRTLYRALVTVSALIVVLFCAYNALVRAPEQAAPPMAAVPQPTSGTSGVEEEEAEPTPIPTPLVRKEGFYTFLLVATDEGGGNTDTLMVAAYDTAAQTVGAGLHPPGHWVHRTWSKYSKINAAFYGSSPETLKEEIQNTFGIPVDYYILVDPQGASLPWWIAGRGGCIHSGEYELRRPNPGRGAAHPLSGGDPPPERQAGP